MINPPMDQIPSDHKVTGLILAGGRGQRMGGADKGLVPFRGRPLVEYLLEALAPQTDSLMISANRNLDRYRRYDVPVVTDRDSDFFGPLAGILAGLAALEDGYLLSVPCDAPRLAADYRERMEAALRSSGGRACVAHDGEQVQPVYLLLHHSLAGELRAYLDAGGRRARDWVASLTAIQADFSDHPQQFRNLNRPGDEPALLHARERTP